MKKIALIFCALAICTISCSDGDKDMPVLIGFRADGILIKNESSLNFTSLRLKLNGDFKFEFKSLAPFETKTIYFFELSDKEGKRFNVSTTAIKSLYIAGESNTQKYWAYFEPK